MTTGRLTTHVLDIALGRPAAGLVIRLYQIEGSRRTRRARSVTNADGRVDRPLLEGAAMTPGRYEIRFEVGRYHRETGQAADDIPFLDIVPVRFGIGDTTVQYHVPLLLSPFGYSTYRGS